jgi:hypothetical protein
MRVLSFFVKTEDATGDGPHSMLNVVNKVNQAITDGRIQHTGVAIDVFHGETILPFESPELGDDQHELLLGVTKPQQSVTLECIGTFVTREEPAFKTAATLMLSGKGSGPIQTVEQVTLLRRWAIAHGYTPRDFVRFLHHRGPMQTLNRDEFVFEAQLPVDTGE